MNSGHNAHNFHLLGDKKDTSDAAVGLDYKDLHEHRIIVPQRVRQLRNYEFVVRFVGAGLSSE